MEYTGYECGQCGYEPTHDKLRHGICPDCDVTPEDRTLLHAKLERMPVGSSVQVWRDMWGPWGHRVETTAVWMVTGRREDDTAIWACCEGLAEYETRTGTKRAYVRGMSALCKRLGGPHNTTRIALSEVLGETRYSNHQYTIHDLTPTSSFLARRRLREASGMTL